MKKILYLFSIVLSTFLSAQKIPIKILPSGHIIAKATIEGKEGNFISIQVVESIFSLTVLRKTSSQNLLTISLQPTERQAKE
ncbi:hypothetical protein [Chryseobacterium sp. 5_R23647]|uniref:hypothetical protein n=1 Tax=Chryseobacterium sp. 5_R23647 TaxID=2258964 RepID=UPI000E228D84|nr:hypothetical protein [Chryseobacterium sp. 5_R23647]REC43025.1 hypothetical protein DRF69_09880 [Chryseobacterium sp. 5_R23647]